jgi:hypothetical protein
MDSVDFRSPKRKTALPEGMLRRGAVDIDDAGDDEEDGESRDGQDEKGRRREEGKEARGRESWVREVTKGRMLRKKKPSNDTVKRER